MSPSKQHNKRAIGVRHEKHTKQITDSGVRIDAGTGLRHRRYVCAGGGVMKRYKIHTPPYAKGQLVESDTGTLVKLEDLRQIAKELSATASAIGMRTDDAIAHQLIASIQVLLKEVQS